VGITLPKLKSPGTKLIAPPQGCDPKSRAFRTLLDAARRKAAAVNEANGDDASRIRVCAAHCRDHQASKAFMFFARPNVGANRPAEAGGVSLARDSGGAAARQAYTACRSGSG